MVSAAELVDVLQRRAQLRGRRPPGEFPPGWQRWFAEMGERVGAVTGATADAVLDLILLRPLAAAPGRSPQLTRRQAFFALWHQDWRPVAPDERRWHWTAIAFTTLWHAFFAAMLLWLMYLQYLMPPAAPEGEDVVMVQYVGRGAPEEPGGGEAPAPSQPAPAPAVEQPAAAAVRSPAPPPSTAAIAPPSEATESSPVQDQPTQQPPPPQPIAVSEPVPSAPRATFVLPPANRRVVDDVRVPQIEAPVPQVLAVEAPAPTRAAVLDAPVINQPQPVAEAPPVDVPLRDLQAPTSRVATPAVPSREITAPSLRTPAPDIAVREAPAPVVAPASSTPATSTVQPSTTKTGPSPATASSPGSTASTGQKAAPIAQPGAGLGPKATPAPGSFPTPRKNDDWGDATRNQPGGKRGTAGLYDSDGRLKLGEPPGSASGGPPPGSLTQEIKDLDRAGTWLKRKPNDYQATAFDRYWVPSGTLLQEWVRKGIKQVAIPIPGSNKRIVCVVSLLQFGGGCGVSDPNLNDQPAVARPPPDIPFKPELQEDNGSVRKPPGG